MYLLIKRANFLASKNTYFHSFTFFLHREHHDKATKKFDEFTMLKQSTIKFTGRKEKEKTAQSGSKPPCPLSGC